MENVEQRIRNRIRLEGPLSFATVMEESLYGKGGYYARDRLPISVEGDYLTGSTQPLLARATFTMLRRLDALLGHESDYWELGYGNADHVGHLVAFDPTRAWAAGDRIRRPLPTGVEFKPLDAVPDRSLRGLIFSYELFDAFPVYRLVNGGEGLRELKVGIGENSALAFEESDLSIAMPTMVTEGPWHPDQIVDWTPEWGRYYGELAKKLKKGIIVTIDYGYDWAKLVDPRARLKGTLACYRDHRAHRRLLEHLGHNDLTAHVDFTALRGAGESQGLETLGFMRQAEWLTRGGIFEGLEEAGVRQKAEAMTLLDPLGMGHDLRVLIQGIGVEKKFLQLDAGP